MNSFRSGLVAAIGIVAAVTTHCSASNAAVVNGGFEIPASLRLGDALI